MAVWHTLAKTYTLYPEFSKVSISAWKLQTVKQKELKYIAQRNCMYKALFSGEELTRVNKFFGSLPILRLHTRDTLWKQRKIFHSTDASLAYSKGNENGSNGNNRTNRSAITLRHCVTL